MHSKANLSPVLRSRIRMSGLQFDSGQNPIPTNISCPVSNSKIICCVNSADKILFKEWVPFCSYSFRSCASDFPAFPGRFRSSSASKKSRFFQKISQTHCSYHMSEKQFRGFLTTSIFKKTTSPHPIFRIWSCPAS